MNSIPKEYAEGPLEEQINTSYAAVEYAIPTRGNGFEGFCVVFVVDVSVTQRELDAVKQSILEATSELKEKYPLTASVGLITYSRDVTIYDIGGTLKLTKDFGDDDYDSVFPSYLIFDGTKAITVEDAIAILGEKVTFPDGDNNNNNNNNNSNSGELPKFTKNVDTPKLAYMCDVRMCYNAFCALVNAVEAEGDAEPVETRPECAVGTAMTLASALLAVSCTRAMGSRAVLFIGNPCTVGPGAIVGTDRRKSKIRTHADIQSGNAPLLNPALDVIH